MINQGAKKHPLETLLEVYPEVFHDIVEAWAAAGAIFFGIWLDDVRLGGWLDETKHNLPMTTASIRVDGDSPGELRVYGLTGAAVEARLAIDAQMIGQLAAHEHELNEMTMELIENQDQLLALYQLTQSTRSQLTTDETLRALASEACRLVKADAACILLISNHPMEIVDYPAPLLSQPALMVFFGQMQDTGRRILLQGDVGSDLLPPALKSLLIEPIRIRGEIRAMLALMNKSGGFLSPDIKLLQAIAEYAGAQIESVLLYQESLSQARLQTEMELAQDVQLRLLPQKLPQVLGLDIFAGSLPALQVGGDFYDCICQPGSPFIFTVGDVTGKGMPAALLMAMTRTMLRSKARSLPDPTPANILGSSNEDMYDDFTEVGMFATVFVGQYDHADRTLHYANAGHSPVIYCPAGGTAYLLEADGTAMGVLPESLCQPQSLTLCPGDVLVAATDGFSEARNHQDELFGYERLLKLVEELAHEPAQRIATHMFESIGAFSAGHQQDDDQTLFVVKGV
jgi:phosphoserine phosphatase RsbU/P